MAARLAERLRPVSVVWLPLLLVSGVPRGAGRSGSASGSNSGGCSGGASTAGGYVISGCASGAGVSADACGA